QPAKRSLLSGASDTKSLISGLFPSDRLPIRIVCSCVTEPKGSAIPWRIASTPATKVVPTAPIPGRRTNRLSLSVIVLDRPGWPGLGCYIPPRSGATDLLSRQKRLNISLLLLRLCNMVVIGVAGSGDVGHLHRRAGAETAGGHCENASHSRPGGGMLTPLLERLDYSCIRYDGSADA